MRPGVLVLDEPTASLDVPSSRRVMDALGELRRQGVTLILVEHRLAEAAHLADRLVLMDGGRIVADGAPLSLLSDRQLRKRMGLRRPVRERPSPWTKLIQTDGGGNGGAAPLLVLEGVSAGYNRRAVIHDVDLALYPGEFVALVGDNGAGKSTLALVAAGLVKPLKGRIDFDGGARPRPGLDVALLFQDPCEQLFTDTVEEEVAFGPLNYGCHDPVRHLRTLCEADLEALRARRPLALSAGQQQRTALIYDHSGAVGTWAPSGPGAERACPAFQKAGRERGGGRVRAFGRVS
jgi:energy-coupling factor transport system ATP-binding protein